MLLITTVNNRMSTFYYKNNLRNHIWDFSHGLVYCPIAKVASSTWFSNFVQLVNLDLEGLEQLKQSRIPLTEDTAYVKTNQKNIITKIKTRQILRNITTMAKEWEVKDMQKV